MRWSLIRFTSWARLRKSRWRGRYSAAIVLAGDDRNGDGRGRLGIEEGEVNKNGDQESEDGGGGSSGDVNSKIEGRFGR